MNGVIPSFDANGVLPPGVYPATLDEIRARFGASWKLRRVQMESVEWMIDLARRAGISRIVLNGSFATDRMDPNDVDCVLLTVPNAPADAIARAELDDGLPFLDIALVDDSDFDFFINRYFTQDRGYRLKGLIEVIGWN